MRVLLVDGRWYLEGWCHRAEDVRLFRLDRVEAIKVLDAAGRGAAGGRRARPRRGPVRALARTTSRWSSSWPRRRTGSPTTTRSSRSRSCPAAPAAGRGCGRPTTRWLRTLALRLGGRGAGARPAGAAPTTVHAARAERPGGVRRCLTRSGHPYGPWRCPDDPCPGATGPFCSSVLGSLPNISLTLRRSEPRQGRRRTDDHDQDLVPRVRGRGAHARADAPGGLLPLRLVLLRLRLRHLPATRSASRPTKRSSRCWSPAASSPSSGSSRPRRSRSTTARRSPTTTCSTSPSGSTGSTCSPR